MKYLLTLFIAALGVHCHAQPAATDSLARRFSELSRFYEGSWKGAGEFANGRKVEATVSFRRDSICSCLVFRHEDLPPGQWKSTGMWNLAKAERRLFAFYNDAFSGARLFTSDRWTDTKLVLLREMPAAASKTRFERFIFEIQGQNTYKMTWEISPDGKSWKLGDYLVFRRTGTN